MEDDSRYWIGIDLGTTNSVVAYCDRQAEHGGQLTDIRILELPQVVSEGEVRALSALPSFLYLPSESELASNSYALPWEETPPAVVGVFAREREPLCLVARCRRPSPGSAKARWTATLRFCRGMRSRLSPGCLR